jgi:hypothetical protein
MSGFHALLHFGFICWISGCCTRTQYSSIQQSLCLEYTISGLPEFEVLLYNFISGFYSLLHFTLVLFTEFMDAALAHNTAQFNKVSSVSTMYCPFYFSCLSPPSRRSKVVTRINAYLAPPFLPIAPMHIF